MMIDRLPGEAIDIFVQAAGVGAAFPPVGRIAPPRRRVRPPRPGNGALACLYPHYMLFTVGTTRSPHWWLRSWPGSRRLRGIRGSVRGPNRRTGASERAGQCGRHAGMHAERFTQASQV
jgi:hypothetical protein